MIHLHIQYICMHFWGERSGMQCETVSWIIQEAALDEVSPLFLVSLRSVIFSIFFYVELDAQLHRAISVIGFRRGKWAPLGRPHVFSWESKILSFQFQVTLVQSSLLFFLWYLFAFSFIRKWLTPILFWLWVPYEYLLLGWKKKLFGNPLDL